GILEPGEFFLHAGSQILILGPAVATHAASGQVLDRTAARFYELGQCLSYTRKFRAEQLETEEQEAFAKRVRQEEFERERRKDPAWQLQEARRRITELETKLTTTEVGSK